MLQIFCLLIAYQVKHFLADFPFQTPYMLRKFSPGWEFVKPLAAHAGVHAMFTWVIANVAHYWIPSITVTTALSVTAIDFAIHFVMDRIKASPQMLGRYKALSANEFPEVMRRANNQFKGSEGYLVSYGQMHDAKKALLDNKYFWWALGLDQMIHHLTHYLIIYLLVSR